MLKKMVCNDLDTKAFRSFGASRSLGASLGAHCWLDLRGPHSKETKILFSGGRQVCSLGSLGQVAKELAAYTQSHLGPISEQLALLYNPGCL